MIDTTEALASLTPGAEYTLRGDTLEWHDSSQTQPTASAIAAEISRLETLYTNNEYQRDRAPVYASLQAQLDMQYWDQVNNTTTWKDHIDAAKAAHPKPE